MTIVLVRGLVSIAVYFLILGVVLTHCSTLVARSNYALFKRLRELDGWGRLDMYSAFFFGVLSAIAGLSTWYYIGGFFKETFLSHGQGNWLVWAENSDLFVQAYRLVSQSKWQWFWSSQLLMAACSFVGFLIMSDRKDTWAFVLLGFLGAISVALALFLSDQIARRRLYLLGRSEYQIDPTPVMDSQLHRLVSWPIMAGLVSIMLNSWIGPTSAVYAPNLIFLHIILIVPVVAFNYVARTNQQGWRPFWFLTTFMVGIYMIYQWSIIGRMAHSQGLYHMAQVLISAIHANNCQISIGLDLIYTTVAIIMGVAWAFIVQYGERVERKPMLILSLVALWCLVPLISVSFTFPLFLALDGDKVFTQSWRHVRSPH